MKKFVWFQYLGKMEMGDPKTVGQAVKSSHPKRKVGPAVKQEATTSVSADIRGLSADIGLMSLGFGFGFWVLGLGFCFWVKG